MVIVSTERLVAFPKKISVPGAGTVLDCQLVPVAQVPSVVPVQVALTPAAPEKVRLPDE